MCNIIYSPQLGLAKIIEPPDRIAKPKAKIQKHQQKLMLPHDHHTIYCDFIN